MTTASTYRADELKQALEVISQYCQDEGLDVDLRPIQASLDPGTGSLQALYRQGELRAAIVAVSQAGFYAYSSPVWSETPSGILVEVCRANLSCAQHSLVQDLADLDRTLTGFGYTRGTDRTWTKTITGYDISFTLY